MGYDVTHHPISAKEMDYFVFMPYGNRLLINERIAQLTTDPDHAEFLQESYEALYEECDASNHMDGHALSQLVCCISSFLHPYWYSRNICFSFLIADGLCKDVFTPLSNYTNDSKIVKKLRHKRLLIDENFMPSGFIEPEKMAQLAETLILSLKEKAKQMKDKQLRIQKENRTLMSYVKIITGSGETIETPLDEPLNKIEDLLQEDVLDGIVQVLQYCKENNLGMIEASDLVVPIVNSSSINTDNLNASFLENDK
jgi:hypothetical protein